MSEFRVFCPVCTEELRDDAVRYIVYTNRPRLRVCCTCWDLYRVLAHGLDDGSVKVNTDYWVNLHNAYLAKVREIDRLKPGRDYFA